jgi:hypothetical protein
MATKISGAGSTTGPDWTGPAQATAEVQGIDQLRGTHSAPSAAAVDRSTAADALPGLDNVLVDMAQQVQAGELSPQTDLTRLAIERMIQARMPNLPESIKAARANELHDLLSADASFQALLAQALRTQP